MPNLLPTGYETEIITAEDIADEAPIGYRNGVSFDYELLGDFRRDGKNKLLDSDGIESWKSWVFNCMQTERYKHLAYGTDFGIESDKVFAASSREEAESILTRQVTEAILADPYERTEYIDNIEITWPYPDSVQLSATLHGIQDVTIDVTEYITKSIFSDDEIPASPTVDASKTAVLGKAVLGKMVLGYDSIS